LRLSELAGLDVGAVDLATGEVRVWGKGAKERIVPVGAPAREAIRVWLAVRAGLPGANPEAMFVGRSGRRIGVRAIGSRLAAWAVKRGLTQHVHPHMLRHSFASHLLQSSGDLRAVQEMLGHASIASTQVYTHLDFQHLAKVYDEAHPRARTKTKPQSKDEKGAK
jgi:integrase/recombinase XerC